jgi:hypothetical protein
LGVILMSDIKFRYYKYGEKSMYEVIRLGSRRQKYLENVVNEILFG